MSINWVMLNDKDFVLLPGEKLVYKSPPRTTLSLSTPNSYPAQPGSVSIASDSGTIYLTNQRLVYVPMIPTEAFQSFSASLLKLHDTHITVPWFGPNAWAALVEPVPGGNLPPVSTGIELKLTFKEGGAPDFHANFERIKERLQQAVEAARDSGVNVSRRGGHINGVNMDAVHLDQLPSYEASGHDRVASPTTSEPTTILTPRAAPIQTTVATVVATEHPAEAPPGYEESQTQSIQQELDRLLVSQ